MNGLSVNNYSRDRRAYSLNINRIPPGLIRPSSTSGTFEYIHPLASVSSVETQAQDCDPLRVLIPITDGILIIMAVIFLVALGIVALIVAMAIIKVHFVKGEFDSIWTNDWLWSDAK